jgi:hypothetical protein
MTKFVPKGYLSIREALNRLGSELFPAEWTGEEYKAPEGLISKDEWLNWDPARGGDAPGQGLCERQYLLQPRQRCIGLVILAALLTKQNTWPANATGIHEVTSAFCLKLAISKQLS